MNDVLDTAKSLSASIKEIPEIKEYLQLKELYETDEELADLRRKIALLESEHKFEEKTNLLNFYNNHPIVVNYNLAKEDALSILQEIKNIISD